ncbi:MULTISPECIES: hypothetical protein [unclassified Bradyrhizobium]
MRDVNEAKQEIRARPRPARGGRFPWVRPCEAVAACDGISAATDGSPFTAPFNRFSNDYGPMLRGGAMRPDLSLRER